MVTSPRPSVPAGRDSVSHTAPLVLFLLVAATIATAGALSYVRSAGDLRQHVEQELASIAALKVHEIERWRAERLAAVEAIAAHPTLAKAVYGSRVDRASIEAVLVPWFDSLREIGENSAIALVSVGGEVRFWAGEDRVDPQHEEVRALVRRAVSERRALLSDAHRHEPGDKLHLSVAAPVTSGTATKWVVLVRIDPYRQLYGMIQSWPTPSPTAETLLAHRNGAEVGFSNELRHRQGDPDAIRVPFTRSEDPAVRGVAGERGVIEGVDYRGRRVLAAIEKIPGTEWTLVAKIDVAEALAPLASTRLWVAVVAAALLAAAGAGTALWWRAQSAAHERARLRHEEERRTLSGKLEHLTKYAFDMVLVADEDHCIIEANDRALAMLKYTRDELVGMPVRELRDPATLSDFEQRLVDQIELGAMVFETRFRCADGCSLPVEVSVHTDVYEGRRLFHAIVRDISARKTAEEALQASEAKFRAAFEFASLGIVLLSPDGRIVETNRAFRTMLGFGEEDMRGIPCLCLHEVAETPSPGEVLEGMREGRIEKIEMPRRFVRKDGSVAETIMRSSALRDESGAFRFSLGVVEDVTERKRLEAQLLLADRMASIGTLAAGVAHEINNPLSFILANVDFSIGELRRTGADPEILRALEDTKSGGKRVCEIVRDLKSFSRETNDDKGLLDLRKVLQTTIGIASNEIRHRAQLVVDEGEVAPILASEHRISQVVLNLLINAAQAIPEGHASENLVRAATFMAPDGRAVVEISDTGAGIAPEILPRIFDPFFTTKPVGVGTGLGLSICHGIVTALGGDIEVDSVPGRGSTFRVRLPPGVPRQAVRNAPAPPSPPARRGRILVVDDEVLVARAVARILSPPHDPIVRTSARAALEEIASGRDGVDLVLCDLMMPEMTGMELHARLESSAPELARSMIFLTGGAFTPDARAFLERVPNAHIEKPFDPRALRDAVARALSPAETALAAASA